MTGTPAVTVVIPTYNMAGYLASAVGSVLLQEFQDFELLVLDNASTDGTPALMAGVTDPRVRYHRNERNLGLAGNVHRGCSLARGRYTAILGADDLWDPRFLGNAAAFLDGEPGVAMVHGPAAWIDRDGRRFGGTGQAWTRVTPGGRAMLRAFGEGFCFSAMLMRTEAIRATGRMDERWQEVIDLWLFLRMCLAGDVGYLDRVLVEYRVHDQAMSMPMYRENLMFRRQLAAAREAFAWPEAVRLGAGGFYRPAARCAARIAMQVLHLSRASGRAGLLRNLLEIVRNVPEAALWPQTWARVGFGLLPAGAMEGLRRQRRRRATARAAQA